MTGPIGPEDPYGAFQATRLLVDATRDQITEVAERYGQGEATSAELAAAIVAAGRPALVALARACDTCYCLPGECLLTGVR